MLAAAAVFKHYSRPKKLDIDLRQGISEPPTKKAQRPFVLLTN